MATQETNPTEIARLRRMIGDTSTPFVFSDEEIESRLKEFHGNMYRTAADFWLQKAASVNPSATTSYSVGAESYNYSSPEDAYAYFMKMYQFYSDKASPARMVRATPAGEKGRKCGPRSVDISRLTQDHMGMDW